MTKYRYEYDIEGWYGVWSRECTEDNWDDALKTLQVYRENCPNTLFRIRKRKRMLK